MVTEDRYPPIVIKQLSTVVFIGKILKCGDSDDNSTDIQKPEISHRDSTDNKVGQLPTI